MYGKRVLLLIPHPDDEVVGAATAIARLRNEGGEIFGLYLTTGVPASAGSWIGGRLRYRPMVARRWEEASIVARAMGLTVAGRQMISSRQLKSHLDTSLRWIRDQARHLGVDRVWVPAYEGGHQDHDVASFLGSRLRDDFDVWEFAEYNFAGGRILSQSFVDPTGEESLLVLDEVERSRKRELLDWYASEEHNLGYVEVGRECFRRLVEYDYARRPHPGRLFYERFHWVPFHPRIDHCRPEQVCEALRLFGVRDESGRE